MAVDNGETMQGQRYDEERDIVIAYTETMKYEGNADSDIGTARTDVIPNDAHSSKVRTWTQPSLAATVYLETPTTVNLNLPDVLTAAPTVVYSKAAGAGSDVREVGAAAWVGASGGMSLNPTSRSNASASIVPDVQLEITQVWSQNVPARSFLFYLAGNITAADVLSRLTTILTLTVSSVVAGVVTTSAVHGLSVGQQFKFITLVGGAGGIATATTYYVLTTPTTTTFTYAASAGGAALSGHSATSGTMAPSVLEWPRFKPVAHTLTLKGEQVSVSVTAEANFQYRWSDSDVSYAYSPTSGSPNISEGYSQEASTNVRTVRIPPTIHGALTITGATDTQAVTADAEAEIPAIAGTGGAPTFSGGITASITKTSTANAAVTPTSLSATSGFTAIPTASLYLLDVQAQPYRYGLNQVRATLVNFNAFA